MSSALWLFLNKQMLLFQSQIWGTDYNVQHHIFFFLNFSQYLDLLTTLNELFNFHKLVIYICLDFLIQYIKQLCNYFLLKQS